MNHSTISPETVGELETELQRRLSGRVVDLRVLFQENRVVLQGRALTYHAKQLAQHAALRVTRPLVLVNEIEVQPSPGYRTE
jgi:hypothetical protein